MAGHAQPHGILNYTCSFYPTYPTWDPEEDEEETALAVGIPKPKEMRVDPEQVEPDVGVEPVVPKPEETTASVEEISKD